MKILINDALQFKCYTLAQFEIMIAFPKRNRKYLHEDEATRLRRLQLLKIQKREIWFENV